MVIRLSEGRQRQLPDKGNGPKDFAVERWIRFINRNSRVAARSVYTNLLSSKVTPTLKVPIFKNKFPQSVPDVSSKDQSSITYDKVCEVIEKRESRVVALVGEPGSGKTTLMKKLVQEFIDLNAMIMFCWDQYKADVRSFDFVQFLTFKNNRDDVTPCELLFKGSACFEWPLDTISHTQGYNWLIANSNRAIFFIDGLETNFLNEDQDEIGYFGTSSSQAILCNLILGNLFPDATVVISSRSRNILSTLPKLARPALTVALTGLTVEDRKIVMSEATDSLNDNAAVGLSHLSSNPLFLRISQMFHRLELKNAPSTLTEFVVRIFESIRDLLQAVHDMIPTTEEHFAHFNLNRLIHPDDRDLVSLLYKTILAACLVLKLDWLSYTEAVSKSLHLQESIYIRRLICGLLLNRKVSTSSVLENVFSEKPIASMEEKQETLKQVLSEQMQRTKNPSAKLELFHCLYESQDTEFIRANVHEIDFENYLFSPSGMYVLSAVLGHCKHLKHLRLVNCGLDAGLLQILSCGLKGTEIHIEEADLSTTKMQDLVDSESLIPLLSHVSDKLTLEDCVIAARDSYTDVGNGIFVNLTVPIKHKAQIFLGKMRSATGQEEGVAVKKIEFTSWNKEQAEKMVQLEKHPNVVQCKAMSVHQDGSGEKFIYIAMELCDSVAHNIVGNQSMDFDPGRQAMLRILHGALYLHENKVGLGNLQIKHILRSQDGCNVKINIYGSSIRASSSGQEQDFTATRSPKPVLNSLREIFSDIINRIKNKEALSLDEIEDLFNLMQKDDQDVKVILNDIIGHPFFWEDSEKLIFCRDIFDSLLPFPESSDVLERLENVCTEEVGNGWFEKVVLSEKEKCSTEELRASKSNIASSERGCRYDQKSAFSLLRFIRNCYQHFDDDPELVQKTFQSQEGIWKFFAKRFPNLLCKLYNFSKQLSLDTDQWRLEVSDDSLDTRSLYDDITPASVIGQQGGILRVGGTVVSIDEGTFLYPCAVWATEDLDRSTWDDEYISISPQLNVRFQYPLLKPATVCMNTWCTSGTDDCEVYVFHYAKEDGSADIIATLPLGNDRKVEFKCKDFSPLGLKVRLQKLLGLLFDVAGYLFVRRNEYNFVFCLDEKVVKKEVKSDMGAAECRPFAPLRIRGNRRIQLRLICENPQLHFSLPTNEIFVNGTFKRSFFTSILENPDGNLHSCNVTVVCKISTGSGNNMVAQDLRQFQLEWISNTPDPSPRPRSGEEMRQSAQPVQVANLNVAEVMVMDNASVQVERHGGTSNIGIPDRSVTSGQHVSSANAALPGPSREIRKAATNEPANEDRGCSTERNRRNSASSSSNTDPSDSCDDDQPSTSKRKDD